MGQSRQPESGLMPTFAAELRLRSYSQKTKWHGWGYNADVNAAKNILAAGHAVLACGGNGVSRPVKQEPTEGAA